MRGVELVGSEDQYDHSRAFLEHLKRSETPEEAQRRRYPITIVSYIKFLTFYKFLLVKEF